MFFTSPLSPPLEKGLKNHGSPRRGKGSASHTKTLTKGGLCPESVKPFPSRGKVWIGVDVSLLLSLRPLELARLLPKGRKKESKKTCRAQPCILASRYFKRLTYLSRFITDTNSVTMVAMEVPRAPMVEMVCWVVVVFVGTMISQPGSIFVPPLALETVPF